MIADPPDLDRPPEISLQAPEEVRPPPRKRAKLTTANEESRLTKRLDGTKTFQELYPPGQVEKKKAAMAFFALLSKNIICTFQFQSSDKSTPNKPNSYSN